VSWTDDEPGMRGAWAELGRMRRRALARPLRTLALALLVAAAAAGARARKTRVYRSRVVLRVTEGDLDAATAPRPNKQLRAYVLGVAFSSARLAGVIRQFELYPRERARDPSLALAVEAMRDDLDVEVWRNYFVEARQLDDAGRSARVAVAFEHRDPQVALDVTRRLGALVVEQEEETRRAQADAAAAHAAAAVSDARDELTRRRATIAAHKAGPLTPLARVELADLQKSLEPLEARLHELEQRKAAFDLRAQLERHQLGLRFELVDPGQAARLGWSKPRELATVGAIVFVAALPLAVLFVGAFDARVRDADDVRRLGLEPLGALERFAGDNMGALDARLRRRDGARARVPIE
jgi:hypothetical protein